MGEQLPGALRLLVDGLEARKLKVNWDKTGWLTGNAELASKLAECWEGELDRARGIRCLGCDGSSGVLRSVVEQDKRFEKARRLAARVHALRSAGAPVEQIFRCSPTATAVWGSAVTGIADLKLNGLRVAALRSEGRLPAGASVGLRLKTMHRGAWRDPLLIHTGGVMHAWTMCLETSLPSEAVLESVLEGSRGILRQKSPWARCHNPAQALLLALARVGGSMCSATRFRGPSGEEVDLRFFSPGRAVAVARRMAASASDILAISKYNCWRSEIHWGPLGKVLFGKASDGLTRHERNIVRSLVSGTHCPQARLAKHKKSASDLCKLCGCRGTLFHRGFDCPCADSFRRTDLPPALKKAAWKVAKLGEDEAELSSSILRRRAPDLRRPPPRSTRYDL